MKLFKCLVKKSEKFPTTYEKWITSDTGTLGKIFSIIMWNKNNVELFKSFVNYVEHWSTIFALFFPVRIENGEKGDVMTSEGRRIATTLRGKKSWNYSKITSAYRNIKRTRKVLSIKSVSLFVGCVYHSRMMFYSVGVPTQRSPRNKTFAWNPDKN